MRNMPEFVVAQSLDGISVKNYLRRHCDVSARLLAKLKWVENGITANGKPVRSVDTLRGGDVVRLILPTDERLVTPAALPVEVVYEDESIIVFNKPPQMPVHPVHGYRLNTLANAAAYYSQQKGESYAFRAVNRLDSDTSGLVLAAKNGYSHTFLSRHTQKLYMALCEGELTGSGTIDAPIRIKPGHTVQREVGDGGVRAVTHYRAERYADGHTLLSITLETGRTHQIRTHFASIGHPLAGDDLYGGSRQYFSRQCLHCARLELVHPMTYEHLTIEKQPEDWLRILHNLIKSNGHE